MGLFDGLRSGVKWRCKQCGTVHKSNPEKCRDCGHTVFIQHNSSTERSRSSSGRSRSGSGARYRCSKCRHVHDRKPFVCDECGSSAVREIVSSSTAGGSGSLHLPHPIAYLLWLTFPLSAVWVYINYLAEGSLVEWIAIPAGFIMAWIVIWILSLGIFGRAKG